MRKRVVQAIGAGSASRGLAKVVSLLSTLVMARLISPEDFGLMALAMTVTGFIGFFNEIGIGAALIQRPTITQKEVNGCFGIGIVLSVALFAVVFMASWPAAVFFELPALQRVMAVLGLGFFFGAINTVPGVMLKRELRFQTMLWSSVVGAVVQSLVAIPLAYIGMRYWAMVGAFFAGQIVVTVWLWCVTTWRPSWPLHLREGRSLLSYGLSVTYTRLLWHFYMNADKMIIGKLLNAHAVGIYDVSRSLANIPTSQITGMVNSIAAPVFSRLQADPARLRDVFLRLNRGVTYLTFPALMGIAVVAPDLVPFLLGADKWQAAIVPMQALCISEVVASFSNLQSQLLISTGHVSRLVRYTGLCAVVMPLAIGLGVWAGGLLGVAFAWALVYPLLSIWLLRETLGVVGVTYLDFWRAIRQPLIGSMVMVAVVAALQYAMAPLALPLVVTLACCMAVGALTYLAYLIIIDRDYLTCADLGDIRVLTTIVGGRVVFERKE